MLKWEGQYCDTGAEREIEPWQANQDMWSPCLQGISQALERRGTFSRLLANASGQLSGQWLVLCFWSQKFPECSALQSPHLGNVSTGEMLAVKKRCILHHSVPQQPPHHSHLQSITTEVEEILHTTAGMLWYPNSCHEAWPYNMPLFSYQRMKMPQMFMRLKLT